MSETTTMLANYAVLDRDTGEAFGTTYFSDRGECERERDRLALKYGKEVCLGIGKVNPKSPVPSVNMLDVTDPESEYR